MVDDRPAAGTQHASQLAQHGAVPVVVEIAERGEPEQRGIETRGRERKRAHVPLDELGAGARLARLRKEERIRIEPRNVRASLSDPVRDPPVPTGHVEHIGAGLELQQPPDELRLALVDLRRQPRPIEVEVVLAEHLGADSHRSSATGGA
jgi:hypothetical protein